MWTKKENFKLILYYFFIVVSQLKKEIIYIFYNKKFIFSEYMNISCLSTDSVKLIAVTI